MKLISRRTYPLLSLAIYSALASAAPPSTSPYYTDGTSSSVQDATSNSIGQVNMITCIMHSMRPEALVNKPSYNALVDETKCDQEKRASSGTQVASYMTSTVTVTRASNTDPMLSKIWIDNDDEDGHSTIFVHISATAAPTTTNPYGSFRLDFCGKGDTDNSCSMNGYMEGTSTGLRYFETEQEHSQQGGTRTTAMQLNTLGSTSGTGQLKVDGGDEAGTYTFAYNASLFLRNDGTNNECFSRDATDPDTGFSVWRYGLYDATTGERVVRNSGFAIEYSTGGTTYQGFLGYGGLSLPPIVMNAMPSGATVQKVEYANGNTPVKTDYTVVKAAGKLTKYTKNVKKLNEIDQIKFFTFLGNDGASYFAGAQANSSYEMYWDDANGVFKVSGHQSCSQNGCSNEDYAFDSQPTVAASKWSALGGIQGNSQSLGGELFIDLSSVSGAVTSTSVNVVYRTQDLVYPAQIAAIPNLYCVRDCPTSASISTFLSSPPQQQGPPDPNQQGPQVMASPYVAATANNWQPTSLSSVVTYHFNSDNTLLQDAANSDLKLTDADALSQYPQFMNGLRTGRLVTSLDAAKCANDSNQYCDSQINDVDVYYQWETGPSSFNQFAAVKDSSGTFVHFDAPLLVNFTVPSGVAYHQYAGTSLVLQYGGYGDLWGIPGYCVTADTNTIVPCTQDVRYVPSFQIPFDATTGKVTSGDKTYLVKWLDREIRFAHKSASVCSDANLQLPTSVTLPTANDLKDPGNANSDMYIGVRPVVNEAPRVIQGDVKF